MSLDESEVWEETEAEDQEACVPEGSDPVPHAEDIVCGDPGMGTPGPASDVPEVDLGILVGIESVSY